MIIVLIVGTLVLVKGIAKEFPEHAEEVARLFYEFGRDPKRYKDIAEYMVDELKLYPSHIAKKIIDSAVSQFDDFPKPRDLRRFAQDYNTGSSGPETDYPCDDCDGEGIVMAIMDSNKNIIDENIYIEDDDKRMFYSTVIGRCKCRNGDSFGFLEVKDWRQYYKDFAKSEGDWCTYNKAVSRLCLTLNKRVRDED